MVVRCINLVDLLVLVFGKHGHVQLHAVHKFIEKLLRYVLRFAYVSNGSGNVLVPCPDNAAFSFGPLLWPAANAEV
jgi:hypothetical protein